MNIVKKYWVIIILLISSLAIIIALIAEYVFNILPCKMCMYQRYSYYLIIIFSFIYIFVKKISLTWYYWINTLFFSIGLFFALWHVGIEQKIIPGLPGCSDTLQKSKSLKELKDQILNQNIISCDEIIWTFAGLSAATLNSLLLILLLLVNTKFLLQHNYEKEKKI